MYVPETNMPLMCHISHMCQLHHVHILDNYVSMYALYKLNTIYHVTKTLV